VVCGSSPHVEMCVASQILDQFKSAPSASSGVDIREVVKVLTGLGHTEANIMQAVNALATDGHLYNTIDDHHYAQSASNDTWM